MLVVYPLSGYPGCSQAEETANGYGKFIWELEAVVEMPGMYPNRSSEKRE